MGPRYKIGQKLKIETYRLNPFSVPAYIYYGEVVKKHKDRGRIRYLVNYTNEEGQNCEVYTGVVGWIESPPYWRFFKI